MKSATLILILWICFARVGYAQDSSTTRVERIAYVTGATLAFSLADYIAWNLDANIGHNPVWIYRGIQGLAQAGISYFLYKTCGLKSAIAFNLIWWTWGDDLAFYGYQLGFNMASPWPNRTYRNDLRDNHITWAGWTPIGLLRPQGSAIARSALYGQAAVGLAISMAILW